MDDLYALPPEAFTAARDAAARQARADGDRDLARELTALRRPTVPAHLVNLLVRAEPDLVRSLLELGGQLGEAQRSGSGDALRALGEQRRALVAAVTARAVALGGRDVTAAVRGEVEATLEAALADPAAADAVRTGRLVRALSYAGFGGADLDGAVAALSSPSTRSAPSSRNSPPTRSAPTAPVGPRGGKDAQREAEQARAEQVQAAERVALDAAGALDDAVRSGERAARAASQDEQALAAAVHAEQEAERALTAARTAREEAAARAAESTQEAERAADAVRAAQDGAEAARAALDRLRRSD